MPVKNELYLNQVLVHWRKGRLSQVESHNYIKCSKCIQYYSLRCRTYIPSSVLHTELDCPRVELQVCGQCGVKGHTSMQCKFFGVGTSHVKLAAATPPERVADEEEEDKHPTLILIPRADKPLRALMKSLGIPTARRTDHNIDATKLWCQEQNIAYRET